MFYNLAKDCFDFECLNQSFGKISTCKFNSSETQEDTTRNYTIYTFFFLCIEIYRIFRIAMVGNLEQFRDCGFFNCVASYLEHSMF